MDEPIISVKNLSKIFEIPHEKRDSIKSYFMNPFKKVKKDMFHALDNISFEVKEGEFVGIIGRNGSGKSTLLKLLSQVYSPTEGTIEINGTLVPFLELGVGFNPELSGRENVFLNGTILGMKRKFIESKFNEIVDFAEIREFIDLQVKNYSSGMLVRLAFSIAVQARADIYLLDEIMAVGDGAFQLKSLAKMQELLSDSHTTVVLVSHNMTDIRKYCKRLILINNGKIVHDGDVETGIHEYEKILHVDLSAK
jgi:ABC-2 type transport system ATP-binding protein